GASKPVAPPEEAPPSRPPGGEPPPGEKLPPPGDEAPVPKGEPGTRSEPPPEKCDTVGEPVDVVAGTVVVFGLDASLPGMIPVRFERRYSSARVNRAPGALGRGWSHGFEQFVVVQEKGVTLQEADGRLVHFATPKPGESAFHRRERLSLSLAEDGSW